MKIQYSYFITSLNLNQKKVLDLDFSDILTALFMGDLSFLDTDDSEDGKAQQIFDYQIRKEVNGIQQSSCVFDKVPN